MNKAKKMAQKKQKKNKMKRKGKKGTISLRYRG